MHYLYFYQFTPLKAHKGRLNLSVKLLGGWNLGHSDAAIIGFNFLNIRAPHPVARNVAVVFSQWK